MQGWSKVKATKTRHKPAVPPTIMGKGRSLANNLDELKALFNMQEEVV